MGQHVSRIHFWAEAWKYQRKQGAQATEGELVRAYAAMVRLAQLDGA